MCGYVCCAYMLEHAYGTMHLFHTVKANHIVPPGVLGKAVYSVMCCRPCVMPFKLDMPIRPYIRPYVMPSVFGHACQAAACSSLKFLHSLVVNILTLSPPPPRNLIRDLAVICNMIKCEHCVKIFFRKLVA